MIHSWWSGEYPKLSSLAVKSLESEYFFLQIVEYLSRDQKERLSPLFNSCVDLVNASIPKYTDNEWEQYRLNWQNTKANVQALFLPTTSSIPAFAFRKHIRNCHRAVLNAGIPGGERIHTFVRLFEFDHVSKHNTFSQHLVP